MSLIISDSEPSGIPNRSVTARPSSLPLVINGVPDTSRLHKAAFADNLRWYLELPWPSETDPHDVQWIIIRSDGTKYAGHVPEGITGPLTLDDLVITYGWGIVVAPPLGPIEGNLLPTASGEVTVIQGPMGPAPVYDLFANRPSASTAGDRTLFVATDQNGGTLFEVQTISGIPTWVQIGIGALDNRLVNPRVPIPHAPTHGSLGSDPLALGAEQITSGTLPLARLSGLSHSQLDASAGILGTQIHDVPATLVTGLLGAAQGGLGLDASSALARELVFGTGSGAFTLGFLVSGDIPNLDTSKIVSGILSLSRLSGITTAQLSGTAGITSAQIASVAASTLTGTISSARLALVPSDIPNLDAAKIASGTMALDRLSGITTDQLSPTAGIVSSQISSVLASTLTGTINSINLALATSDIPNLDASKITSGTIALAQLAGITKTQLSGTAGITAGQIASVSTSALVGIIGSSHLSLVASDIPNLDTSKITTGVFATGLIPNLSATKITSGALAAARGGTGLDSSGATDGQLLIGTGSGLSLATLTAGVNITITNSSGGITIDSPVGGGTVTSVDLAAPSEFSVSGSPVTGTGTLTFTKVNQAANLIYAGPTTGAAAAPTFRSLVTADIPSLPASRITTGQLATARGGTGLNTASATNGQLLIGTGSGLSLATLTAGSNITITNTSGHIQINAATAAPYSLPTASTSTLGGVKVGTTLSIASGVLDYTLPTASASVLGGIKVGSGLSIDGSGILSTTAGGGTVTSVAMTVPTDFSISGSAITASGTLGLTWNVQTGNVVMASPAGGGSGTPTFRSLVAADIPNLDTGKITTGTLSLSRLSGITTTQISATAGIVAGQIASVNPSVLTGSGTVPLAGLSGITTTQLSPTAGITSGQIASIPNQNASVITTGTLALARGGTNTDNSSQLQNLVWASPDGSTGTVTYRALVAADIPSLNASKITAGTLSSSLLPTADASNLGAIKIGTTLSIASGVLDYTLPTASASVLGGIKVGSGLSISLGVLSTVNNGTVTSVAMTVPVDFGISGSAINSSGTLGLTWNAQTGNVVMASPSGGGSGTPTFRSLVSGDIPSLDVAKITTGTFATSFIPSLDTAKITTGTLSLARLSGITTTELSATAGIVAGQITSVNPSVLTGSGTVPLAGLSGITTTQLSATAGIISGQIASIPNQNASIITTGALALARGGTNTDNSSQLQNLVWASPDGSTGAVTYRALVAADIPNLDASKITAGTLSSARLPIADASNLGAIKVGTTLSISSGVLDYNLPTASASVLGGIKVGAGLSISSGVLSSTTSGGTVTSVDLTAPSEISVAGSPITASGTLALTWASQTQNQVFAAPSGSSGVPGFRLLVSGDIPNLDAAKITTGAIAAARLTNAKSKIDFFINTFGIRNGSLGVSPAGDGVLLGSFPLTAVGSCFKALTGGTVFTSLTTAANNVTTSDVTFNFGATNDAFYISHATLKYTAIKIKYTTASAYSATLVWEYWNGSVWSTLLTTTPTFLVDATAGTFPATNPLKATAGTLFLTFNPPSDWASTTVNAVAGFYVRLRVSAFTSLTTGIAADQIWLYTVTSGVGKSAGQSGNITRIEWNVATTLSGATNDSKFIILNGTTGTSYLFTATKATQNVVDTTINLAVAETDQILVQQVQQNAAAIAPSSEFAGVNFSFLITPA